jgi:hypothetical protein
MVNINETAKKAVAAQRRKDAGELENVDVEPLLVGFNEKGAIYFNNELIRQLEKELSPALRAAGVEFKIRIHGSGISDEKPEFSILLIPGTKIARLELPSLKDIPKRA